jgi:sensor histidine kinase YesM
MNILLAKVFSLAKIVDAQWMYLKKLHVGISVLFLASNFLLSYSVAAAIHADGDHLLFANITIANRQFRCWLLAKTQTVPLPL